MCKDKTESEIIQEVKTLPYHREKWYCTKLFREIWIVNILKQHNFLEVWFRKKGFRLKQTELIRLVQIGLGTKFSPGCEVKDPANGFGTESQEVGRAEAWQSSCNGVPEVCKVEEPRKCPGRETQQSSEVEPHPVVWEESPQHGPREELLGGRLEAANFSGGSTINVIWMIHFWFSNPFLLRFTGNIFFLSMNFNMILWCHNLYSSDVLQYFNSISFSFCSGKCFYTL